MRSTVWSISTLVRYIKSSLDNDLQLQNVLIKGEISNFTNHRSGHYYFTLKDSNSRISCVMFASYARKVTIPLKEGMKIIVSASVSMYEPQGSCQLYVTAIQVDGLGDLFLQLEEVKKRLNDQGLFDPCHKKKLPEYPMNIAVISARSGAATQDVFTTLARRWPLASVFFYPCLVQGKEAVNDLIQTITTADKNNHDLILVVRGGGSIEDLWCFNSEDLARCVYACQSVIVSGVGHETDTTLIDYVADRRAPTPTAAAELATPDIQEVKNKLVHSYQRMLNSMRLYYRNAKADLDSYKNNRLLNNPMYYIQNDSMKLVMYLHQLSSYSEMIHKQRLHLNFYQEKLGANGKRLILKNQKLISDQKNILNSSISAYQQQMNQQFINHSLLLDAFSPLKVVSRGYSLAYKDKKLIRSVDDIEKEDLMQINLSDGIIHAIVKEKEKFDE